MDWCNWPQLLKLKDCPYSNLFEKRLPHCAEFIFSFPKEYSDPFGCALNLAVEFPKTLQGAAQFANRFMLLILKLYR